MKRRLFGSSEQDDKTDPNSTAASVEKKRRRKNVVETPKHYPKSERQQLALVLQMTSVENSPEPASPPPSTLRKTPGGSGRKDKIHKRNERGETSLHLCTIRGDLDSMKELVKLGADVNVQDFAGWTPLHEACNHGHQEITRYLLEHGANVNTKGLEDDTPLHDAVTNSHRDLVELLLKFGADPLLKNKRGERPLDIAEDQVIKDLMLRFVANNRVNSDFEQDSSSPSRSEDSGISHKNNILSKKKESLSLPKQQDLNGKSKKKKHKPAFDTSSDSSSCGSCDEKSKKKQNSFGNVSHLNGYRPPNASVNSNHTTPKRKKKKLKFVTSSSAKMKNPNQNYYPSSSSDTCSSSCSASDSSSSDSDCDYDQRQSYNGVQSHTGKKHKSKAQQKNNSKRKSLFGNNKLTHIDDKSTSQHLGSSIKKKTNQNITHSKRNRSHSNEERVSSVKHDNKQLESTQQVSKTTDNRTPKMNGFTMDSPQSDKKKQGVDDSVYDFSSYTEDVTAASAISLKRDYKDSSSDLFDVLCLGKPSKTLENNKSPLHNGSKDDITSNPKVAVKTSKEKDKTLLSTDTVEDSQNLQKTSPSTEDIAKTQKLSVSPTSTKTNGSQSQHNHVETKLDNSSTEDGKIATVEKSPVVKISSASDDNNEVKSEKKIKKQTSSLSPKKVTNGPVISSLAKVDHSTPKRDIKTELKNELDANIEKKKKIDSESNKTNLHDKLGAPGSLSHKKKKKRKRKHSQEESDQKHRQRSVSSEQPSTEKLSIPDKGTPRHSKSLLKKTDSNKSSLSGHRKFSVDGKNELSAAPVKKKARSSDSTGSETSIKSNKHSNNLHKTSKLAVNSIQDKVVSSPANSVKKDKPEPKKIALMSDCFLSELDKSSQRRRMEQDRRLKIQRKKKLQQMKAEKEARQNSVSERSTLSQEKPIQESTEPVDSGKFSVPPSPHTLPDTSRSLSQASNGSPYHEQSTSQNSSDISASFKPLIFPPVRSMSQVEQRGLIPTDAVESWGKPSFIQQDKKPGTTHRSYSFSGQPADGTFLNTQDGLPSHQLKSPLHFQDGSHYRQPIAEPLHRVPVYSNPPVTLPYSHTNGPSLPPANHPTTVGFDSVSQLQHKIVFSSGNVSDAPSTVTEQSNVPTSSTVAIKVSDDPPAATQPVATADTVTDLVPENAKVSAVEHVAEKDDEKQVSDVDNEASDEEKADIVSEVKEDPVKSKQEAEEEAARVLAEKEEEERKVKLENYINERLSKLDTSIEERVPKQLPVFIPTEKLNMVATKNPLHDKMNVYEEWMVIQKQILERRKKYYTAVVIPQTPNCYLEYMTYRATYLLNGSKESWLSIPVLAPPPSLGEEMQALFMEHEKERVKLCLQHATQREKLIVACEQEIMRVHSRAARMLQNQQVPFSACSVLLDKEVYHLERRSKRPNEESNTRTSIRDRFNARMMISWLQDVDDKYGKIKKVLLDRQRRESQALHAVQRTEWFLKLQEIENQGQQKRWSNSKPEDVSELYVPVVNIPDDFPLLPG